MNDSQTHPISNPAVFAVWVDNVASHNEQFSEALQDAADIMATIDPTAALGLYRAADTAHATVNALRTSRPTVPPQPNLMTVAAGLICALIGRTFRYF